MFVLNFISNQRNLLMLRSLCSSIIVICCRHLLVAVKKFKVLSDLDYLFFFEERYDLVCDYCMGSIHIIWQPTLCQLHPYLITDLKILMI